MNIMKHIGVDHTGGGDAAVQIDGNDIVHVSDFNRETGKVDVVVFASTDEQAEPIFKGQVKVR